MIFKNYSGGAEGSDLYWNLSGEMYDKNTIINIESINYSFKGHTPKTKNNIVLTQDELNLADDQLKIANIKLKRKFPTSKEFVNNLLRRNWYQVLNSKSIYAVGFLDLKTNIVDGGTGWAVQMAIDNLKDVYVFNLNDNSWYKTIYVKKEISYIGISKYFIGFKPCETPILTESFAGIGTRELTDEGKKAIDSVYKNTYFFYNEIKELTDFIKNNSKLPINIEDSEDKMIITILKK